MCNAAAPGAPAVAVGVRVVARGVALFPGAEAEAILVGGGVRPGVDGDPKGGLLNPTVTSAGL